MTESTTESPLVGVIMGSRSDWETMKNAADMLEQFGVPHECRVVSAHRTPQWMAEYAESAVERGLKVIKSSFFLTDMSDVPFISLRASASGI